MIEIETNPSPGDAFEADLKAYLDGELPLLRRVQVRAHLARCPKCQEELKFMQTIERELESEETARLGADLRAKILKNAPLEPSETEFERPKMPRHIKRRLVVSGVAALLVASVVVPQLSRMSAPEPTFSTDKRASEQMPAMSAPPMAGASSASSDDAQNRVVASMKSSRNDFADAKRRGGMNLDRYSQLQGEALKDSRAGSAGAATNPLSGVGNGMYLDTNGDQRAVHKDGNLTVEVADAEKSGADAEQIIKNVGGFVASNSLSTGAGERRSATLDCRIPVDKFEVVVGKISQLGKVRAKSINGEDITARVASAAARKSTLSNELSIASAQLRQKEKSRKAGDVASVYYARQEVRQLRLQAAQARAQLETLRRFADLSSLYLTVQDKPKVAPVAGPTSELGLTMRDAWKSFLVSARLPIQLIIWILAYSPLWVPLLIVWKKWGRNWLSAA